MTDETWAVQASTALEGAGYRTGGARRAVLEFLDAQTCALSAVEIEDGLRGGERRVARASVYRILDELERLRLVQKVEVGQSMVRYEAVRAGSGHHHHLVCDRCGSVLPFADDELERAIRRVSRRLDVEVSEHEIVLRGDCGDCRN